MLKRIVLIFVAVFVCFPLCSCSGLSDPTSQPVTYTTNEAGERIMDKLLEIEEDWTPQQVFGLLGEPDRYGERSVVAEVFYTVDDKTEAAIAFWSDGIEITLQNIASGEC